MPTTIQIQKRTLELLKKIKGETKSSSYDETIKHYYSKSKKRICLWFFGKEIEELDFEGLKRQK